MICKDLQPIHPGEYLAEMLEELNISQALFARTIGVSPMRISHIVKGTRPVTAELALLVAKAFEQTPRYWLNLQASYDLILSVSVFKKTEISCAFQTDGYISETAPTANQLNLFDF